jgi:NADH-quinone oxidoreductase subunit N
MISDYPGVLPSVLYGGVLLMLIGLAFKVAAAPFHFWAPDVYDGSPTHFTGYMSTVVKTAAFAALLRLFSVCFSEISYWWAPVLAVFAALSILAGNIMALTQVSFKRMIAWSGVANTGYMLMAVVAMNEYSASSLLLYAAAYSVASIGIFSLLMSMTASGNENITSLNGFSKVNQFPALVMTILLLSIAGIPPVAGFFAKYAVFAAAIGSGYVWLAIIAVLGSVIGVFYYLKVIVAMYQPADRESVQHSFSGGQSLVFGLTLVVLIILSAAPAFLGNLL